MTVSPRTGRFSAQRRLDYGRLVGVFDSYVRTRPVDLFGSRPRRWRTAARQDQRGDVGRRVEARWAAGLAPATARCVRRVARGYLVFLEQRGIGDLESADRASVLAFLESLLDRWAAASLLWVVSNFRPFLSFTGRFWPP